MTDLRAVELAKRIDGAINFLDNPLMPDAKELARAVIAASERETPMEVNFIPHYAVSDRAMCPGADCLLILDRFFDERNGIENRFCPSCGQRLKWRKG